jgi:hypothetical protein
MLGEKVKKDDWAKVVGRAQAVRHLYTIYSTDSTDE